MKKISFADWFLFILLALIWGSSFILMKKGMEAFSSSQVAALRLFLAGAALAPVAYIKRREVKRNKLLPVIIMGLCGSGIPAFLFTAAETQISSSLAGIFNSLTPIFVLLIGILFFRTGYKPVNTIGIIIGFCGSAALMWFENNSNSSEGNNWFALLVVLATVLYGISNQVITHYLKNENPLTITSVALVIMSPAAGVYLLTTDIFIAFQHQPLALSSFIYTLILGVGGTAVALIIYNHLIQQSGALFASTVTYLMPLVAVIWGVLAGESVGSEHLLAMLVILIGVYLVRK